MKQPHLASFRHSTSLHRKNGAWLFVALPLLASCSSSSDAGDSTAGSAGAEMAAGSGGSGGTPSTTGEGGLSSTSGAGGDTSVAGAGGDMVGKGGAGSTGVGGGSGGAAGKPMLDAGLAGSGGAGGSNIVVHPGNCTSLPPKGQWENVSPPNSNYAGTYTGINAIVGRPDTPGTIFAGADSNGFYRSDDCGSTWKKVNTGRGAMALGSGRPWSLALDPVTPDVMYIVEGYGTSGLWKTTNAGVDWDQVLTPNVTAVFYGGGQITGAAIDPTDHQHLVVESHGGTGCGGNTCIAESTDAGSTWKVLQIPTGWAENSSVVIVDKKTWLYPTLFGGLWRTTDQGGTWAQVTGHSTSGNYYEPYIWRDTAGRYYLPSPNGLIASKPNDTSSWSQVAGEGGLTLVPTGTSLYMSSEFTMKYYSALQSDPTKWTAFPAPPQAKSSSQGGGGVYLIWDGSHHLLYSANFDAGLWRVVTD